VYRWTAFAAIHSLEFHHTIDRLTEKAAGWRFGFVQMARFA
jgi:hypothetical protein